MARSNSFVTLIDMKVVADAEIRAVGEKTLVSFTVADNPGNDKDEPKFIRVTTSGKLGENMSQLRKGDRVNVVGKETYNTYKKKDGSTGVGFKVDYPMTVTRVFVGGVADKAGAEDNGDAGRVAPAATFIDPKGRPAGVVAAAPEAKRGPGRPPKAKAPVVWADDEDDDTTSVEVD